jgi:hypothetical protein
MHGAMTVRFKLVFDDTRERGACALSAVKLQSRADTLESCGRFAQRLDCVCRYFLLCADSRKYLYRMLRRCAQWIDLVWSQKLVWPCDV